MPKNRDYTGLAVTPSSMAWLIRQRSVLKGRIDQQRKLLDDIPRLLVELQRQLDAIDAVLPLHEVKVDPLQIVGRRPKSAPLLPFGVLSKGILKYLREARGEPRTTTEIAMFVARTGGLGALSQSLKRRVVDRVRHRLKTMRARGLVESHHCMVNGQYAEGRWSLADEDEEGQDRRKAA